MYPRPVWMAKHCARSAMFKEMRQSLLRPVCNLETQIKSQGSRTYKQVSLMGIFIYSSWENIGHCFLIDQKQEISSSWIQALFILQI